MPNNPFIRDRKSVFIYPVVWAFVSAFYFSLIYWGVKLPLELAVPDSLVFNLLLAGAGLSYWYPAKSISYKKEKFGEFVFTHISGSFISTALWLLSGYFIVNSISGWQDTYRNFFFSTIAWRILIGVLFYFLIVSFYYIIIFYTEAQERLTREVELKSLITEAELKSLKSQINPHFIFNSLNSISSLTIIDPDKARTMILKLADFLRYTIKNNSRQMNSLEDELSNIRLYLDIEKIRFEDKFEYAEEISETCKSALVPNMILQPLFENAIKHAVYDALEKVRIGLKCFPGNEFLVIEVRNTLEKDSAVKGTGVGLKNIRDRLNIIYNRNDLMKTVKSHGEFNVTLFIPQKDV